ncbi:MAG: enoyl-ACP reductase, partial [Pseudomonadota bacterium]
MSVAISEPAATHLEGSLLKGRRGLVMGVANDHSIAWGIARLAAGHGADLAFSYQNDAFRRRLEPLAESVGSNHLIQCDVADPTAIEKTFDQIGQIWPSIDFVVHAVAYSDKAELSGRYVDTSLSNFQQTLAISCYSFTAVARCAEKYMTNGGSLITMTYLGAERVMPNYNVMGVAKAALEASIRYMASDLGPSGIRVNGISAGPMRTLAGSAIADAR